MPLYDFSVFLEVNKAATAGYWKIDPVGLTGGVYTVTLTGTGFWGISNYVDLRIIKRTSSSNPWTLSGGAIVGTGSNAAPVVGRTGMSGFGEFTLGGDSGSNSLPVTWLSFEGARNEEGVLLNWKTAKETNNAYFIVERKGQNQSEFQSIEKVTPAKSGSVKSYSYLDQITDIHESITYRIKQVDLDGNFSLSKVVNINALNMSEDIIVGPNPASDYLLIKNFKSNESIELIDALGKVYSVKPENDKIKLNNIPAGFYLLNLTDLNGKKQSLRIIKE